MVGAQVEPKEKGQGVKDIFLDKEQPLEQVFNVGHLGHLCEWVGEERKEILMVAFAAQVTW